jgi:hypothetical protein
MLKYREPITSKVVKKENEVYKKPNNGYKWNLVSLFSGFPYFDL